MRRDFFRNALSNNIQELVKLTVNNILSQRKFQLAN
jgi:hypothetical protein